MLTTNERLQEQLDFLAEIDKLKNVFRQTWLLDTDRKENDAEHSWHLGVYAMLLLEHAADDHLDLLRVIKMVLIHDLVEIDAGDTYAYDEAGIATQTKRELEAAERVFGMLPPDQAAELRALWDEFELRRSPEARYAAALDRVQPFLHNYLTKGKAWREHGVTSDQVLARCRPIGDGVPALWRLVQDLVQDAVARGWLGE